METHIKNIYIKLIILNNKILRVLQNVPYDTPVVKLYADFFTMPLPDLHRFQILQFVHKFIHHPHKLPSIFSTYFSKNYMFHNYSTRSQDSLHSEYFRSSLGQRCIKYKGSILWNTLPDDLKCISSIGSFKKNLQELFIADYMYNI